MRIAALPMYDLPEVARATDALWTALAERLSAAGLEEVPDRLQRAADPRQVWASPDLLFAQTCGFPLTHAFAGRLALVATPCYSAAGCEGATYCSRIVVRSDDPRSAFPDFSGAVAAINSEDSHSGCNMLRWRVAREARRPFFSKVERTGSHLASLDALRSGRADIAAIDCVTFALLGRHRPDAVVGIRILEDTPRAPALPYVTSIGATSEEVALLREGVMEIVRDPALAPVRAELLLAGAEVLPLARYEAIRTLAAEGAAAALCS
jgi:ABC-type phosphate/phosphonate transport system substrate-binding protein